MVNQEAAFATAERIGRLLDSSGVSWADLLSELDFPEGVILQEILDGRIELTPTDLVTAADFLDVPVTVLSGQIPMDQHLGVSLRLGTVNAPDVPADALKMADMHLRHRALLDTWLDSAANPLKNVGMSTDRFYERAGKESAQRIRDALGLNDHPISDLVGIVEGLGFPVIFQPLPSGMHGLNVRDMRQGTPRRVIVISSSGSWTLQRFTLAHELCHAMYDDPGQVIVDVVEIPDRLPEHRAETFARHLLLPARALKREVAKAIKARQSWANITAHLMIHWGVSRKVILRALQDDQLASPEDLASLEDRPVWKMMVSAGLESEWNKLCSTDGATCGSPWLVSRAVDAYGQGFVGAHVVADLLGQDLATTQQQLVDHGWADPQSAVSA